ncbi:unnamed protein product [Ranitomeya imitator]|uniref:Uncharacterized protein n=1 Tax=Ranitomeya imitator TaxID=111125 RepID=A0ABN9KR07_9NEOB|nr:unnamed protein product [Ranitomeya imitator]
MYNFHSHENTEKSLNEKAKQKSLSQQLDRLSQECETLRGNLEEADEERAKLEELIQQIQGKEEKLRHQMKEQQDTIKTLRQEKTMLEASVADVTGRLTELQGCLQEQKDREKLLDGNQGKHRPAKAVFFMALPTAAGATQTSGASRPKREAPLLLSAAIFLHLRNGAGFLTAVTVTAELTEALRGLRTLTPSQGTQEQDLGKLNPPVLTTASAEAAVFPSRQGLALGQWEAFRQKCIHLRTPGVDQMASRLNAKDFNKTDCFKIILKILQLNSETSFNAPHDPVCLGSCCLALAAPGTGDITEDMEKQLQANSIRISILEEENSKLRISLHRLGERCKEGALKVIPQSRLWTLPTTTEPLSPEPQLQSSERSSAKKPPSPKLNAVTLPKDTMKSPNIDQPERKGAQHSLNLVTFPPENSPIAAYARARQVKGRNRTPSSDRFFLSVCPGNPASLIGRGLVASTNQRRAQHGDDDVIKVASTNQRRAQSAANSPRPISDGHSIDVDVIMVAMATMMS